MDLIKCSASFPKLKISLCENILYNKLLPQYIYHLTFVLIECPLSCTKLWLFKWLEQKTLFSWKLNIMKVLKMENFFFNVFSSLEFTVSTKLLLWNASNVWLVNPILINFQKAANDFETFPIFFFDYWNIVIEKLCLFLTSFFYI